MGSKMNFYKNILPVGAVFLALSSQAVDDKVINLLTDCTHEYSFNLSNASRTQGIFKGINCLTSVRTIHKLDLAPINALVVLMDGKMPYSELDAPYLLDYVEKGGGLYLGVRTDGMYADSLKSFLSGFGLRDAGPRLSEDPANWGISAHAPSELIYELKGKYKQFKSTVGLWGKSGSSVAYEIYGDDRVLQKTDVLRAGQRAQIEVDLTGVKVLRLVATDGGDGNGADSSCWFDPHFITHTGSRERVLLHHAASVKVGWAKATQDIHFNGNPLGGGSAADKERGLYPDARLADWPVLAGVGGNLPQIKPVDPQQWITVYACEQGHPAVMARRYGKGVIVSDTAGLYGAAIGEQAPQVAVMRKLIEYVSKNKSVAPLKGGGGWQFSDGYRWELITTTKDGLRIHHNEYSKIYVNSDIRAYQETVKYLTQITGLDEKQKAAQIAELNDRQAELYSGAQMDVDIAGVRNLTLMTTDGGNGIAADHSIFADSWLIDGAGRKTKLELSNATEVKPGYGRAMQDRLDDDRPLSIGGKEYANGIFLHASGSMTFPVEGKYKRFVAVAGCNTSSGGSVGFKVLGDGRELWNDGKIYTGGVPGGDPQDVNYIPEGILFQLKYLPCVGAGFLLPQGSAVDLPPQLRDDWQVHLGMLSHEMGHAWSYPFCERIGEEASAFIFNNLVLHHHHGQRHEDSVTRRLMGYLNKSEIDEIDLARDADNFKYYMFIDLMIREYGEEVWKNYNLLKYALLNKEGARWDAHSTAWLWSVAAGRDVFPLFAAGFGSHMDQTKVQLPEQAMQAGFDPLAVGRLYHIPLRKLPQKRDIFSGLKSFADVRAFYARELAEKGHPKVEG